MSFKNIIFYFPSFILFLGFTAAEEGTTTQQPTTEEATQPETTEKVEVQIPKPNLKFSESNNPNYNGVIVADNKLSAGTPNSENAIQIPELGILNLEEELNNYNGSSIMNLLQAYKNSYQFPKYQHPLTISLEDYPQLFSSEETNIPSAPAVNLNIPVTSLLETPKNVFEGFLKTPKTIFDNLFSNQKTTAVESYGGRKLGNHKSPNSNSGLDFSLGSLFGLSIN